MWMDRHVCLTVGRDFQLPYLPSCVACPYPISTLVPGLLPGHLGWFMRDGFWSPLTSISNIFMIEMIFTWDSQEVPCWVKFVWSYVSTHLEANVFKVRFQLLLLASAFSTTFEVTFMSLNLVKFSWLQSSAWRLNHFLTDSNFQCCLYLLNFKVEQITRASVRYSFYLKNATNYFYLMNNKA